MIEIISIVFNMLIKQSNVLNLSKKNYFIPSPFSLMNISIKKIE